MYQRVLYICESDPRSLLTTSFLCSMCQDSIVHFYTTLCSYPRRPLPPSPPCGHFSKHTLLKLTHQCYLSPHFFYAPSFYTPAYVLTVRYTLLGSTILTLCWIGIGSLGFTNKCFSVLCGFILTHTSTPSNIHLMLSVIPWTYGIG